MQRRVVAVVALLQLAGVPARAAEFIPGWDAEGRWSSNVLQSADNEESDFSLRTGPNLRLREEQGDLTYDLNYRFRYEAYTRLKGLNGIDGSDQFLNGNGAWRVTPTTQIEASNAFAYTTSLTSAFDNPALISTATAGRDRITTNSANASVTQMFGPLWQLRASLGNQLYDYRNSNQSDTTATTGTLQITRAFTPRLIAGMGTQIQRQEFAAVGQIPSRGTTLYQGFGVVDYRISPTWRITAQAGPVLSEPDSVSIRDVAVSSYYAVDPSTCPKRADGTPVVPQFPQSSADQCAPSVFRSLFNPNIVFGQLQASTAVTRVPFVGASSASSSLNYFGTLSMTKDWRDWSVELDYSRSASNSSGLNGSTILDQLEGKVTWTPSALWSVTFDSVYSTQTALNEAPQSEVALATQIDTATIPGAYAVYGVPFEVGTGSSISNAIDLTTVYFTLSGTRRLSRRLSLIGSANYWQQMSGGLVQDITTRVFQVSIGFTWTFDPIPL